MTLALLRRTIVVALFAIFVARVAATYRVFNDTRDESTHLAAGLELLERGRYTVDRSHPPLARLVLTLPPYLAGLRLQGRDDLWHGGTWDQGSPEFFWRTLGLARAGNLLFAAILVWVAYRWAVALYGEWAGLAAVALATFCPNLMGHGSLATLDLAAAATIPLACYCLWRWTAERSWKRCLCAGLTCGVAFVCKFAAVFYLPPIAAGYFLVARSSRAPSRFRQAAQGAAFVLVLAAVIGGTYNFGGPPLTRSRGGLLSQVRSQILRPPTRFARGLQEVWKVVREPETEHVSYLLGRFSRFGWWYYFLVAVAVKSTLPLLLLGALGAGLYCARRLTGPAADSLYLLLPVAVIFAVSAFSNYDVGMRYVLPAFPFFAILGAAVFAGEDRLRLEPRRTWVALGLLLTAWHAAESMAAHPDYLAYFNEIARGREERFLVDSNLDWGQDLARLGIFLRDQHIPTVRLLYIGDTNPEKMGVAFTLLESCDPHQDGWVAASITHLMTFSLHQPACAQLLQRPPDARVGKSIWMYHFPPATTSLGAERATP
jgi:hypothetical protein